MLRSPEKLKSILQIAASESPHYADLARRVGITPGLLWQWAGQSRRDERAGDFRSPFFISWPEEEKPAWWHDLLFNRCRDIYRANLDASIRNEVLPVDQGGGVVEFLTDSNGLPIPEVLEQFTNDDGTPWSAADMMIFGYRATDRYARNPDGSIKYRTIRRSASTHQKIHISRSLMPETYGDKRSITVSGEVSTTAIISERPLALPAPEREDATETLPVEVNVSEPNDPNETDLGRSLRKVQTTFPEGPAKTAMIATLMQMIANDGAERPRPSGPVNSGARHDSPRHVITPIERARYRSMEDRSEGVGNGPDRETLFERGAALMSADQPRPKLKTVSTPGEPQPRFAVTRPTKMV